ncbi:hypothetical protein [Ktedonobacter racemifer]|uniref:Uncharacterized protein n=1 Tax=Ktedonobacter racemifer DSM 44963 TaxID=485913 RepID=D6TUI8_KTERA|nr:hypothetical protein [Ktedonobacter racemifer]EFH84056.1 hypothetical protein Krac_5069 [Ktedonobacter racemifer DSM 44963]
MSQFDDGDEDLHWDETRRWANLHWNETRRWAEYNRLEELRQQEELRKQEELLMEERHKQEELYMEEERHKQEGLHMEEEKYVDDDYYRSLSHMRYDDARKEPTGIESFYFAKRPQRSVRSANDGSFIFLLVALLVGLLLYLMYTGSLHF